MARDGSGWLEMARDGSRWLHSSRPPAITHAKRWRIGRDRLRSASDRNSGPSLTIALRATRSHAHPQTTAPSPDPSCLGTLEKQWSCLLLLLRRRQRERAVVHRSRGCCDRRQPLHLGQDRLLRHPLGHLLSEQAAQLALGGDG
eukprot:6237171-Prymnesium_polylepis.1